MADIRKLINNLASQEKQLKDTQFLAPCVHRGKVRTRVEGMIYTFTPKPRNFEGWGIFQPANDKQANVIEQADFFQIVEYLQHLPAIRLCLAHPLTKQTWLAYPVNESDMQQRMGFLKPMPVYLVTEGAKFETIIAHWDSQSLWFEEVDRRADPMPVEFLKEAIKQIIPPEQLSFKGMTPEMQVVYQLVAQQTQEFSEQMQQKREENRLKQALEMGGGTLQQFEERHDYWLVEWTTRNGELHSSAIAKNDLTVISAGICLSGLDQHFDLQSLVGVVEHRSEF